MDIPQLEQLERRLEAIGGQLTLMPLDGKVPARRGWQNLPAGHVELGGDSTALLTGTRSNVFVVDCDSRDAAKDYLDKFGRISTFTVSTLRGWHFYFSLPKFRVRNSASKIVPYVDVKGEGGYVVAPGSVDKNIVADLPIVEAPPALLGRLFVEDLTAKRFNPAGSAVAIDPDHPEWADRLAKGVKKLQRSPPAIEGENGSGALWNVAQFLMRSLELPLETAHDLVLEHYNPRCRPPWLDAQILHKLEDARDRGYIQTPTQIARSIDKLLGRKS